jgi:hypothetical protein
VTVREDVMEVTVSGAAKEPWHAQMTRGGLPAVEGEGYNLRFRGKCAGKEEIRIVLSQAHEPWKVFDSQSVKLDSEWREFSVDLRATASDQNARLTISNLARTATTVYSFSDFSLRRAGVDGSFVRDANGKLPAFTRAEYSRRSPNAQEEWMRFLWSTEESYWPGMQRFLREELGVRALVVGTQLGWSPFPIQQKMDVLDSHSYWQHPHFPGRAWDMGNWTVKNAPMAGDPNGGTLPHLALQRVAGKPYICTEYNHSAPNSFSAEAFPLLCAYAALQDWDGVFAFAYSHRTDDWDKRYFGSFFDIDQHPAKLATLPGALALFRRGDVQAAREASIATVDINEAILQAGKTGPWLGAELFGVKWPETFIRRVGVRLTDGENFSARPMPDTARLESDTSELTWDTSKHVVLVDAPRSKAVIGEGKGQTYELGGVKITIESDWACVQATLLEGESFAKPKRVLVAVTGTAENTGMKWRDAEKTSVGRDWGKAPSLLEGVRAKVQFASEGKCRAWALDERGARHGSISVEHETLVLDGKQKTAWVELSW